MIVDTSAVVAIIKQEPAASSLLSVMRKADHLRMATCTALELSLVLGAQRQERATTLLREAGIDLVPFTAEYLAAAQDGHARFGRGTGSPARLNFGDCFSYGLASVTGEPLLFTGDDFSHTDVTPAYVG